MNERIVSERKVFSGKIMRLKILKVRFPDGGEAKREVVCHRGASAVIPVLPGNRVILVRQYRAPAGKRLLEIPAGTLEEGEDPSACAARELEEETGYKARYIKKLQEFYPAPGYTTEKIHLFKASGLVKTSPHTEPDEFIKTYVIPQGELKRLHRKGEIKDGKTLIGLFCLNLI